MITTDFIHKKAIEQGLKAKIVGEDTVYIQCMLDEYYVILDECKIKIRHKNQKCNTHWDHLHAEFQYKHWRRVFDRINCHKTKYNHTKEVRKIKRMDNIFEQIHSGNIPRLKVC